MTVELTFTSLILLTLFYVLYFSSGFFSIILCKKYSVLRKYFTKEYVPTYLIGEFIFTYLIIPTEPPFSSSKLATPIVTLGYALAFSLLGNLFYNRFTIKNFFNAQFYQYLIGVIIFSALNVIRVYVQYAWLN